MIMQLFKGAVLVTVVGRRKFLTLLCLFMLASCSELDRQSFANISQSLERNEQDALELQSAILNFELQGEVSIDSIEPNGLHGSFNNPSQLLETYSLVQRFSKAINKDIKSIEFRKNQLDEPLPVYFTIYLDGVCMAFSECKETHLIYFPLDSFEKNKINENKFIYTKTSLEGWYVLKVDPDS